MLNPPPKRIHRSKRGYHSLHGVELRHRVSDGSGAHDVIFGFIHYGITDDDREGMADRLVQCFNDCANLPDPAAALGVARGSFVSLIRALQVDGVATADEMEAVAVRGLLALGGQQGGDVEPIGYTGDNAPVEVVPAAALKLAREALAEAKVAQAQLLQLAHHVRAEWAVKDATKLIAGAIAALNGKG